MTELRNTDFSDTNLKRITLPHGVSIKDGYAGGNGMGCFMNTKLDRIDLNGLTVIPVNCFLHSEVKEVIGIEYVTEIRTGQMFGMEKIILPGIKILNGMFSDEKIVKYIELGKQLEKIIGWSICVNAKSIETFIIRATTPPILENDKYPFNGTSFPIFVPDESVNAYKSATNWARLASRFKPISEYVE